MSAPAAARVRIGRYELVTPLGQGGMARVFVAINRGPLGFDKLVVVKQIRPELAQDHEFLHMFFDEARIAARLDHPNVVGTYEILHEADLYLMVMEYLEGQTLAETLQRVGRGQFPLEEHLWILSQVLAGLHYGHELHDQDGSPLGLSVVDGIQEFTYRTAELRFEGTLFKRLDWTAGGFYYDGNSASAQSVCSRMSPHISVFTSPGWQTFAVTPVPASSAARCRVSWFSATLAVA